MKFHGFVRHAILLVLFASTAALSSAAAQKKEARVTKVVREVNLLAPRSPARPAHVNDSIVDGSTVHTGAESRAELTFADLTITRLGANTIFSFEENGHNVDVETGAILLRVPKGYGGARIRSSAVTVGITGATVMFEYRPRTGTKLIVLEGNTQAWLTKNPRIKIPLRAGQMLVVKPGVTHLPEPVEVDLDRLLQTAILITDFPPLPSLRLIQAVAESQRKSGGPRANPFVDPTGMDARDVRASTRPPATPGRPPPGGKDRNP